MVHGSCSDLEALISLVPPLCRAIEERMAALPAAARQAPGSHARPEVALLEQLVAAAGLLEHVCPLVFRAGGASPVLACLRPALEQAAAAMFPAGAALLAACRARPKPLLQVLASQVIHLIKSAAAICSAVSRTGSAGSVGAPLALPLALVHAWMREVAATLVLGAEEGEDYATFVADLAPLVCCGTSSQLQAAVQADVPLQQLLLRLCLHMLELSPIPLRPGIDGPSGIVHMGGEASCVAMLLHPCMQPALLQLAHSPGVLRVLQAAAGQLCSASAAAPGQGEPEEGKEEPDTPEVAAIKQSTVLCLLPTLASLALKKQPEGQQAEQQESSGQGQPDEQQAEQPGEQQRRAVVARLLAQALPSAAQVLQQCLDVAVELGAGQDETLPWLLAGAANWLGKACQAASSMPAGAYLGGRDGTATACQALTAALRLQWQFLRALPMVRASPDIVEQVEGCSLRLAQHLQGSLCRQQGQEQAAAAAAPASGSGAAGPVAGDAVSMDGSISPGGEAALLKQLWRAHATCASLLHGLDRQGVPCWELSNADASMGMFGQLGYMGEGFDAAFGRSQLPAVLQCLWHSAASVWQRIEASVSSDGSGAASKRRLDSMLMAHLAAVQSGQRQQQGHLSPADELALHLALPPALLPLFDANGGPTVVATAAEHLCQVRRGAPKHSHAIGPELAGSCALRLHTNGTPWADAAPDIMCLL
ncbi:hypothetical protein ABPG75_002165 [Micractinium tetrahymenae]